MKSRTNLILFIVFIALAGSFFIFQTISHVKSRYEDEKVEKYLFPDFEPRKVRSIEIIKGEDIAPFHVIKTHWFDFSKKNLVGGTQDLKKLTYAPKILLRKTGDSLICCYDPNGTIPEQSLYFIYPQYFFL